MRAASVESAGLDARRARTSLFAVLLGLVAFASLVVTERVFEPAGGPFGVPQRIVTCGRSYRGGSLTVSRAQIATATNPGQSPVILEPLLGDLPLTAPFESHRVKLPSGDTVCDTVIYLQIGPDAYVSYGLEGGP